MKRFMTIIFFTFMVHSVFGMEEKQANQESIFNKLIPELQIYTIGQGINARLNSNPDPIEAIIDALKYVSNITSTNTFWLSKKEELINQLKDLAFEKFAPEYIATEKEELTKKLQSLMLKVFFAIRQKQKFDHERNEIIKLIIAGAHPHTKATLPIPIHPAFQHDKKLTKLAKHKTSLFDLIADANDLNLLKLLLIYGGDINFKTKGHTVLMSAISQSIYNNGVQEMINFLIRKGADINLENKLGETALQYAIQDNSVLLVETLLNHGAQVNEDIIKRAERSLNCFTSEQFIAILREKGKSQPDYTPHYQIVELLKAAKNKSDNNQ